MHLNSFVLPIMEYSDVWAGSLDGNLEKVFVRAMRIITGATQRYNIYIYIYIYIQCMKIWFGSIPSPPHTQIDTIL